MDKTPSLRVVIVAFNPSQELFDLCTSLEKATLKPYEIVIVDNGQDPSVVDEAAQKFGAEVIRSGKNLGYGAGVNRGAEGFMGDCLLVVNPDVRFEAGSVDTLIDELAFWPRGGAFGPRILTPEGEVYPSARRFPNLVSGAGHALLGRIWPSNPFTRVYQGEKREGHSRRADWLSGSCILFRREAFDEVGGFDESYFMFFEDTQLCRDLRVKGWRSVYVPHAVVVHEQGTSWRDQPEDMIRAHHASARTYLMRAYSRPWQAPIRAMVKAGLAARQQFALVLAKRRGVGSSSTNA